MRSIPVSLEILMQHIQSQTHRCSAFLLLPKSFVRMCVFSIFFNFYPTKCIDSKCSVQCIWQDTAHFFYCREFLCVSFSERDPSMLLRVSVVASLLLSATRWGFNHSVLAILLLTGIWFVSRFRPLWYVVIDYWLLICGDRSVFIYMCASLCVPNIRCTPPVGKL